MLLCATCSGIAQNSAPPQGENGELIITQQSFDPDPVWVNSDTYVTFNLKATPPTGGAAVIHQTYTITLNDTGDGESTGGIIKSVEAGGLYFEISEDGSTATYDEDYPDYVPEEIGITVAFSNPYENNVTLDGAVTFDHPEQTAEDADDGNVTAVKCTFYPGELNIDVGEEKPLTAYIEPEQNASDVLIRIAIPHLVWIPVIGGPAASLTDAEPPELTVRGERVGTAQVNAYLNDEKGANSATIHVYDPQITIGDVVRGPGLPNSVSPGGNPAKVQVTVSGLGPDDYFQLVMDNSNDPKAGWASISPSQITASGTVTVQGQSQTEPPNPDSHVKLHIISYLNGNIIKGASSHPFAVCAHPVGVVATYTGPIGGASVGGATKAWGSHFALQFPRDEGDLSKIQAIETLSATQSGYWAGLPPPQAQASPQPISTIEQKGDYHFIGTRTTAADLQHDIDVHGTNGSQVVSQSFVYSCSRCGITAGSPAVVPASGFQIIYRVTRSGVPQYFIQIDKAGSANNQANAGTVIGPQITDDEIR